MSQTELAKQLVEYADYNEDEKIFGISWSTLGPLGNVVRNFIDVLPPNRQLNFTNTMSSIPGVCINELRKHIKQIDDNDQNSTLPRESFMNKEQTKNVIRRIQEFAEHIRNQRNTSFFIGDLLKETSYELYKDIMIRPQHIERSDIKDNMIFIQKYLKMLENTKFEVFFNDTEHHYVKNENAWFKNVDSSVYPPNGVAVVPIHIESKQILFQPMCGEIQDGKIHIYESYKFDSQMVPMLSRAENRVGYRGVMLPLMAFSPVLCCCGCFVFCAASNGVCGEDCMRFVGKEPQDQLEFDRLESLALKLDARR